MRIALTGATGYLGGRLLTHLLAKNDELTVVLHPADSSRLPEGVAGVVDPGTAPALAETLAASAPEVVIHLAACQQLTDTPADSDALVEANLVFGARVLAAARAAGARGLVWASTFSLHADGTEAYAPQSLYAATKASFSALAAHYTRSTSLRCVGLELSDTYGPGDPRPKFLSLLATGEPFDATPGEQYIRPLHADDVAAALAHAAGLLVAGQLEYETYSVCGPQEVTVRDLAGEFAAATGRPVRARWGGRAYRANEIMQPFVGRMLPGWKPRYDLQEGLADVFGSEE